MAELIESRMLSHENVLETRVIAPPARRRIKEPVYLGVKNDSPADGCRPAFRPFSRRGAGGRHGAGPGRGSEV